MEFEYEYRREDETFRSVALWRRIAAPAAFFGSRYGVMASLPLILLFILVAQEQISFPGACLAWVASFAWFWARNLWAGQRIAGDESSPVYGRKLCRIDEKGISIDSAALKTWHAWPSVREIVEDPKYISIYYDLIRAVVLPKKSFPTPEAQAQFLAQLRKYASVSKIGETQASAAPPSSRLKLASPALWFFIFVMAIAYLNISTSMTGTEAPPDLAVTVDKATVADDMLVVLGQVKNSGKSEWHVNMVELQFFDTGGKFIDQCAAFTYGLSVKPGESENFKASCSAAQKYDARGGMPILPSTLKHYARVEVRAKSAFKGGGLFSWIYPY